MKIREGFLLRKVGESFVVIPVGESSVDFSNVITLNGTGAFIWECLEQAKPRTEIIAALMKEYAVEKDIAERDVDIFIDRLEENDLLA